MISPFFRSYKKLKQRKILVISAGGELSGIQALYFIAYNDVSWEIISNAFVPYPARIGALIESSRRQGITMADFGWLDYRVSLLFVECGHAALKNVPRGLRKPHVTVLNQLSLWKGSTGKNEPMSLWSLSSGDAGYLASSLNTPVISGLVHHHLLAGGRGAVPMLAGNLCIARRYKGIVAFVNLGLVSRMTVLDPAPAARCIIDSDTGPGMCLINRCAREINCPDGFDRDGSAAAAGTVNAAVLDSLANAPWFLKAAPKEASPELFDQLMQKGELMALTPNDRMATVTALTARTIYDFFRREYREPALPEAIIISGGGVNNLSLVKFLSAYFSHAPLMPSEQIGIPLEMRMPLAIGLSIDSILQEKATLWEDGKMPRTDLAGSLSMP